MLVPEKNCGQVPHEKIRYPRPKENELFTYRTSVYMGQARVDVSRNFWTPDRFCNFKTAKGAFPK